jgi:3'(2'), 5'-bisphosphate nucleotidase
MPDLERFSTVAREAVARAAIVCRSVQRRLDEVRAATKDDRSPVTVADFASQAIVCLTLEQRLGSVFSSVGMVAEEEAAMLRDPANASYLEAALGAARVVEPALDAEQFLAAISLGGAPGGAGEFWTLDPIDGTKGFLRGQQYAIALGYIADGKPVVGVVGAPNLPLDQAQPLDGGASDGSMYVAIAGQGVEEAPCCRADAASTRRLSPPPPLAGPIQVCASVEKAHTNMSHTDRVIQAVGASPNVLRLDSSAKYAVVARGQAHAYLRLPTRKDYVERIWDHAAGCVVATEAGCIVSDVDGRPLDFSHGRGLEKNRGVVVAHPDAHAQLLPAIGKVLSES